MKKLKFEIITDDQEKKILGGFSKSFSVNNSVGVNVFTNNCHGGNCASGCGTGQNQQCNSAAGCTSTLK